MGFMWSDHRLQSSHLMLNAHLLLLGNVFLSQSSSRPPSKWQFAWKRDPFLLPSLFSQLHICFFRRQSLPDLSSIYFAGRAPGTCCQLHCLPPELTGLYSLAQNSQARHPQKQLDPWFQASTSLQPYIQREEGTLPPTSSKDSVWPDLCHVSIPGPVLWFNRCSI